MYPRGQESWATLGFCLAHLPILILPWHAIPSHVRCHLHCSCTVLRGVVQCAKLAWLWRWMKKDSALSLQLSKYSSMERVEVSVKDGFEPITVSGQKWQKLGLMITWNHNFFCLIWIVKMPSTPNFYRKIHHRQTWFLGKGDFIRG